MNATRRHARIALCILFVPIVLRAFFGTLAAGLRDAFRDAAMEARDTAKDAREIWREGL